MSVVPTTRNNLYSTSQWAQCPHNSGLWFMWQMLCMMTSVSGTNETSHFITSYIVCMMVYIADHHLPLRIKKISSSTLPSCSSTRGVDFYRGSYCRIEENQHDTITTIELWRAWGDNNSKCRIVYCNCFLPFVFIYLWNEGYYTLCFTCTQLSVVWLYYLGPSIWHMVSTIDVWTEVILYLNRVGHYMVYGGTLYKDVGPGICCLQLWNLP